MLEQIVYATRNALEYLPAAQGGYLRRRYLGRARLPAGQTAQRQHQRQGRWNDYSAPYSA